MPGEVRQVSDTLTEHAREIRALKLKLDNIATAGGIRETSVVGVSPPGSGGTGTTQSILGAVTIWQNNSGATRNPGDVVVWDGDRLFDVTSTQGSTGIIGVVSDDGAIPAGANAHIRHTGYQAIVNTQGVVAIGDYLQTSPTPGRAMRARTAKSTGVFGIALTASAGGASTVTAFLMGADVGVLEIWNNPNPTVNAGAVLVYDSGGSKNINTTVSLGDLKVIGVAEVIIEGGESGPVRHIGYHPTVLTTGVVAVGDYLRSSTVSQLAISAGASPVEGVFAIALSASGGGVFAVEAYVFPPYVRVENRERAFTLGIAGSIPSAPVSQFADFPFLLPNAGTLLRMKAAVKSAVALDKTVRLRKATAAGGYTNWADVAGFVLTLSAGTNGGFVAIVDPANVAAAEGDLFQLELEDANGPSGSNLVIEVVYQIT